MPHDALVIAARVALHRIRYYRQCSLYKQKQTRLRHKLFQLNTVLQQSTAMRDARMRKVTCIDARNQHEQLK